MATQPDAADDPGRQERLRALFEDIRRIAKKESVQDWASGSLTSAFPRRTTSPRTSSTRSTKVVSPKTSRAFKAGFKQARR